MKYKYAFIWNNQKAFFYADDIKTAKADFQKTYGFDPDSPTAMVLITRTNS